MSCRYEDKIHDIEILVQISYKGIDYYSNALHVIYDSGKTQYLQVIDDMRVVTSDDIIDLIEEVDKVISGNGRIWYCYEYDMDKGKNLASYRLTSIKPLLKLITWGDHHD